MRPHRLPAATLAVVSLLALACASRAADWPSASAAQPAPPPSGPPIAEEARVGAVLDAWHAAAAAADEATYFSFFAPDAVFLGTDPGERWTADAFRAFAHPYFAKGKAWSFRSIERHVAVAADGHTAWFDERLATEKMGECRGTGVLVRQDGAWKIALYDLTIPIPNALTSDFVKRIAEVHPQSP